MQRRTVAGVAVVVVAWLGVTACTPAPGVPASPIEFVDHLVANVDGASFVGVADVIGDSEPELIASGFGPVLGGPGSVTIYERVSGLDTWAATPVVGPADDLPFPNEAHVEDVDGDGLADVIVPGGFFICEFTGEPCGSLSWWKQLPDGTFERHDIVPPGDARFYHRAVLVDFDGDGITDVVTMGETSSTGRTYWFKGTALGGDARFDPTPLEIGRSGGSLFVVADVDGDGDLDVASPSLFGGNYYFWLERVAEPSATEPAGVFERHVFGGWIAPGFQLSLIEDLYGDGTARWVTTNHVNPVFNGGSPPAGVFELIPPADPTDPWANVLLSRGITSRPVPNYGSPGVFGYGDVDGDDDIDLAVSGDGDDRVFWLQQRPDHTFATYVVDDGMGQAGGGNVADLDGDGTAELVFSSYENDVVKVYSQVSSQP